MHTSFISSCNFDYILRDSSGNRRFMIFEVAKIRWGYEDVDQGQIFAQARHLANVGFRASEVARSEMDTYIKTQTPVSTDDIIVEVFDQFLSEKSRLMHGNKIRSRDITDEVDKLSRRFGRKAQNVLTLLGKKGFKQRDNVGVYYTPL